jgi:hypothetical protein
MHSCGGGGDGSGQDDFAYKRKRCSGVGGERVVDTTAHEYETLHGQILDEFRTISGFDAIN